VESGTRSVVLDALDRLACPAAHEDLAAYLQVFQGIKVTRHDFEALVRGEAEAYASGEQRDPWVCPAILEWNGFPADYSLLTRSDWPLGERVVTAFSEVGRQLRLLGELTSLAVIALETRRPGAELLVEQVRTRGGLLLPEAIIEARFADTIRAFREQGTILSEDDLKRLRLDKYRELAEDTYGAFRNQEVREQVAGRLAQAAVEIQLFGGSDIWHSGL